MTNDEDIVRMISAIYRRGEIRLKMIKELAQDLKMAQLGFESVCQT